MSLVKWLFEQLINLVMILLPVLDIDPEFLVMFDNALSFVLTLIEGANYFLPLDVLLLCMTVIFVVDQWHLIVRLIKWIIEILPLT